MGSEWTAEKIRELSRTLKSGDYDGVNLMAAWIRLNEYADLLDKQASAEPPCSLNEALNVIEKWADNGNQLHGDDIPRLRASIDRIAPAQPAGVSDVQVRAMVDASLRWRLPDDFAPDAGINFNPGPTQHLPHCWPVGTNLFTAAQAEQMLRYVIAAAAHALMQAIREAGDGSADVAFYSDDDYQQWISDRAGELMRSWGFDVEDAG